MPSIGLQTVGDMGKFPEFLCQMGIFFRQFNWQKPAEAIHGEIRQKIMFHCFVAVFYPVYHSEENVIAVLSFCHAELSRV